MPKISCCILLLLFLTPAGLIVPSAVLGGDHANLFVYHRFGDDRYPSTNISLGHFREHLELLQREKANVITLGELVSRLERQQALPDRCAVLTIDDAYRSFLTGAMPLLAEYGYRATLFVSTDTVGGSGFLTWEDLQGLHKAGIELGNHSASHAYLLDHRPGETQAEWRDRVKHDLQRAQAAFREHLGIEPELFAYPYGEFSPALVEVVRELDFRGAVGQQSGVVAPEADRYVLPRFPMGGDYTEPAEFRSKLRMRPLPVSQVTPESPLLGAQNPPALHLQIDLKELDPASLTCYVSGQGRVAVEWIDAARGLLAVRPPQALEGRRSKYTLTARERDGGDWFWYSKLWIRPGL